MATDYVPCYQFLQSYADFLSANPQFRPHPILFSGLFCQGSYWPAFDQQVHDELLLDNPLFTSNAFGSLYIPPGWQVTLKGPATNETLTFPNNPAHPYTVTPVLLNVDSFFYTSNNQPVQNRVQRASIHGPFRFTNQGQWISDSETDWKYRRCMGKERTVVGLSPVLSYEAGSDECEDFMTSFCESKPQDPACSCIFDEKKLKEQFCQGSDSAECKDAETFATYISVPCFGTNCASTGYRFQRFRQANCNATYCQQIVQLVGSNVFASGSSTLWCGNEPLSESVKNNNNSSNNNNSENSVIAPVDATPNALTTLTWWQWMLIGFAVLLFCVVIPLFIVLYKTSAKTSTNDANSLRDQQKQQTYSNSELPPETSWLAAPSDDFPAPNDVSFDV